MTFNVTVTGGSPVEVYWDLAGVDNYILGMIGKGATAYRALPANGDARKQLVITVTRYIDRHAWKGTAELAAAPGGATTLQFPRSGLTKSDGSAWSEAEQLSLIQQAVGELVAYFAAKQSAVNDADTSQNIRAIGAGSARVEFFSPTSRQRGTATVLPTPAQDLIGQWLAGGGAVQVSTGGSSSSSSCSNFSGDGTERRRDPL